MNMMAIPSFHRFLQEYLEVVRKLLKLLQTPDLSYTYQWFYLEDLNPRQVHITFMAANIQHIRTV